MIVRMTLHEAARRRILTAALVGALAFLALFATGFHFLVARLHDHLPADALQRRLVMNFFTLAGLYATHFLAVMAGILLPLDTLSGDISTGVIQTLAARPVRRAEILLGKWLAYTLVTLGYVLTVAVGVLAIARVMGHFTPPNVSVGLSLLALEAVCLVTLSIAGGTRFSTVTNGVAAFGLYGLAFLGGWIEQVGALTDNLGARNVGTVASLVMPTESLWQLAASEMQPRIMSQLHLTPFSPASVPSPAMVAWAGGWALALLLLALRTFGKRPL